MNDRSARRHPGASLAVVLALAAVAPAWAAGPAGHGNPPQAALSQFSADHPQARFVRSKRGIERIYGTALAHGPTPEQAAADFVARDSAILGVDAGDLQPGGRGLSRRGQPVMIDRSTGEYKFTLIAYSQRKGSLPVFRADLELLVRNEADSPVVLVASSLRDLRGFSVSAEQSSNLADPAYVQGRFAAARSAALAKVPSLVNFSQPEAVIWAGVDDKLAEPKVVLQFTADNHGASGAVRPEAWLFLADLDSGAIVYAESRIIFTDVSGNVSGMASDGPGADICATEIAKGMPYARVNIGTTQAFADIGGDFTIPNSGSGSVTVQSPIRGSYFYVDNFPGADTVLSTTVTPPGPANFLHNAANTAEYNRAEVNGYIEANAVRDWVIGANPAYPQIGSQSNFPVIVNRNDGYCPGNAWYDPSLVTTNFCAAGSGYPNTAWSSVIYHEYGHHVVESGGSGQGQYGEGMGDVMSTIILDDHRLGLGFFGSCSGWLRDADNNYQYPCSGEIHDCGQLISGAVWSTRNELVSAEPSGYQQTLMDLAVNSVLLHSGTLITPSIYTDWLTLDDDNGDLSDGTPHEAEITAGFGAHNLVPLPPPENDTCADALPLCPGSAETGSTYWATIDGNSTCGSSSVSPDVWYAYTPASSGSAIFSLCGGGTTYDSVIAVHAGCPGTTSNTLACDDDACGGGGPSQVTLAVTAGTTYYVRVTGWNGSAGNYSLTVTGPACTSGCTTDSQCDDGDVCNGAETCSGGVCQPGTPVSCDDGDACTVDSCSAGACVNTPVDCSDGNSCTIDTCVDGQCLYDLQVPCCGNGSCESGEDCNSCAADCVGQGPVSPSCGDGYCEPFAGEDCLSCPADCRGKQTGKPSGQYCCGDGAGTNPVGCDDNRCNSGSFLCSDQGQSGFCCGQNGCEQGENSSNCPLDCGACAASEQPGVTCQDGLDNDCDGRIDCDDSDCATDPACTVSCAGNGASCTGNSECCSNKCRSGTCRGN